MIRIMLADDHPAFRAGIRSRIEKEDDMVVIEEADNGRDALDLAARLLPDVLVLDMELPLATGLEVAREIQRRNLPILVLPLSGFSAAEYVTGVLESGAAGYMTKDESLQDIVEAIRRVVKGGVYISSRVAIEIVDRERRRAKNVSNHERTRSRLDAMGLTYTLVRVLKLIGRGYTNSDIAEIVCRSEYTIRNNVERLRSLIGVRWRPALVAWSWKNGVMQIETEDDEKTPASSGAEGS